MINPFYSNDVDNVDDNNDVYILCLMDGQQQFDNIFCKELLTPNELEYCVNKLVLIKGPSCEKIVHNHKSILFNVNVNFLKKINRNNLQLVNNFENVLLMTSLSQSDIMLYIK